MGIQEAEVAYQREDYVTALALYQSVEPKHQGHAWYRLGYMYANGEGVEEDISRGIEYYRQSAEANNALGAYCLAANYALGRGLEQDYERAYHWYEVSARAGDIDAVVQLGLMWAKGEGREVDYGQSLEWWLKAAEQDHAGALLYIGELYHKGNGVKASSAEAAKWFVRCWQAGNSSGPAAIRAVLPGLEEAAEAGDVEAQCQMGVIYWRGKIDIEKAVGWLERASGSGHPEACRLLGFLLDNGDGVPQDRERAVELFLQGAEGGDRFAQYNTGIHFQNAGNMDEAIRWFRRAVQQGVGDANESLANCLAQRNASRADACEAMQRMTQHAMSVGDGEEITLAAGDGEWVIRMSKTDGNLSVGMSGIEMGELTMSEEELERRQNE